MQGSRGSLAFACEMQVSVRVGSDPTFRARERWDADHVGGELIYWSRQGAIKRVVQNGPAPVLLETREKSLDGALDNVLRGRFADGQCLEVGLAAVDLAFLDRAESVRE